MLERFFEPPLNRAVVAALIHVDEVDDNEASKVTQAQLSRDFLGRLAIGLKRGVLDMVLARGAPGTNVNCDQRFCLIDYDVTAGTKLHHRRKHGVKLALDAVTGK